MAINKTTAGVALKALMALTRITAQSLAEEVGLSVAQVHNVVNGKNGLQPHQWAQIAKYLIGKEEPQLEFAARGLSGFLREASPTEGGSASRRDAFDADWSLELSHRYPRGWNAADYSAVEIHLQHLVNEISLLLDCKAIGEALPLLNWLQHFLYVAGHVSTRKELGLRLCDVAPSVAWDNELHLALILAETVGHIAGTTGDQEGARDMAKRARALLRFTRPANWDEAMAMCCLLRTEALAAAAAKDPAAEGLFADSVAAASIREFPFLGGQVSSGHYLARWGYERGKWDLDLVHARLQEVDCLAVESGYDWRALHIRLDGAEIFGAQALVKRDNQISTWAHEWLSKAEASREVAPPDPRAVKRLSLARALVEERPEDAEDARARFARQPEDLRLDFWAKWAVRERRLISVELLNEAVA